MNVSTAPEPAAADDTATVNRPLRLVISCADTPGVVAAVSRFLFEAGANIVRSDQFSTGPMAGAFFLRMEFTLPQERREGLGEQFGLRVAEPFGMTWRVWDSTTPKRIAVFVSRYDHCLQDLLYRWRRNELGGEIVRVISNWDDFRTDVEKAGLPFHHVPVTKDSRREAEEKQLELVRDCDFAVLARYMQILSADFLDRVGIPVINIHHSFLPAFEGAGPYERAKARGVKLVGATGHYVTADLDAGPIIEQDVVRVTHAHQLEDLIRMGAEVERNVLARAVIAHCEDRVIRYGNSTVVF
jgi:formyltetrahydrofolate deformylase